MKKILELTKLIIAVLLSKFLPKKHYWIIAERGFDARDNGYWFFLYLKKCHPDIRSRFFIETNSIDATKLIGYSDSLLVPELSVKSYLLLCQSDVFAGTHGLCWLYSKSFTYVLQKMCGVKFVFLQHGVTMNLTPFYQSKEFRTDLFICAASPEFAFVSSSFGFPRDVIRLTGFCRYDNLHDVKTKRQILLMPTWRRWMKDENGPIEDNNWVQSYCKLLRSEQLHKKLEDNNLDFLFYPHIEAQKYLPYFLKQKVSSRIKILSINNADVQTLLKESTLLITDYSSVALDFAYMGKQVLYYQFDYDSYRQNHYKEGFFDYKTMLGDWCDNEKDLLDLIQKNIDRNFSVDSKYIKQIADFFPMRDKHNCERVFDAIDSIL